MLSKTERLCGKLLFLAEQRMLIETDASYLAPVPYRGKLNQPAYVKHVAEEIARLREIPLAEVARATTENFHRLFLGGGPMPA